ncbi:MAG: acyltransferase [Gammaproteobacteria bacterium]|nr:acyltransferase [Pseudomonadales bacterium]
MFYRSIHYLRGIAALSVAGFHAFISNAPPVLAGGVDIFFVISGFVMVEATRSHFDTRQFLAARAIRILPLYWVVCALASVLVVAAPTRDWFLLPEASMLGGWPVPEPFLSPGWTLAYEVMFYLLFAACLGRWWLAAPLLVGLASLGSIWQLVITNPIVLEFAFGMIIANLSRQFLTRWSSVLLLVAVGGIVYASGMEQISMTVRWWLLGIPAAALVAGLMGLERQLPDSRLLHFLGSASYSIYLVHMLPMAWFPHWSGLAVGVGAGCLLYVSVERPLLVGLRGLQEGMYLPWQRQRAWQPVEKLTAGTIRRKNVAQNAHLLRRVNCAFSPGFALSCPHLRGFRQANSGQAPAELAAGQHNWISPGETRIISYDGNDCLPPLPSQESHS